ncbi:MAG: hypothetical protein H5T33_07920 [Candidatus Methanosuratus sp.]|nr:hypothetical protein [Candidatus Methanosuratincola sp.]
MLSTGKFKGPFPKSSPYDFEVVFIGENLAIELTLDERDEDIGCYISRIIEGQPAQDFAVGVGGKRVRGRLPYLLIAWGVRWPSLTKVRGLSLKERMPIQLHDYAQMLKGHGQMVLEDNPTFLDVTEPSYEVIRQFVKISKGSTSK